jgi:hypothetical protein
MADILCGYTADRDETLIGYLYGEIDPAQRAAFEAHTATCERCRTELADLENVRERLHDWTAPDAIHPAVPERAPSTYGVGIQPATSIWTAIRNTPGWAQAAAALLVVGASAGMANLDVRYDQHGLSIHTGWSQAARSSAEPRETAQAAIIRRADLDALEQRLRNEFHGAAPVGAPGGLLKPDAAGAAANAQLLRQVRALIQDSERRQQNELALRIAEVVHEFDTKRGSDLVNIRRGMREIQSDAGAQQYILNDLRGSVRILASQTSPSKQ